MEKTRGNGLHWERFHLNSKESITVRAITRWNLPRDMVESPLLEGVKMRLDREQGNLIQAPFPMTGQTRRSSGVTSNPGRSVDKGETAGSSVAERRAQGAVHLPAQPRMVVPAPPSSQCSTAQHPTDTPQCLPSPTAALR